MTYIHYHLNELMARGIVEKVPGQDRSYANNTKGGYRQHIMSMMGRL